MDTLECYRLEIDEIDKQMTSLFEKRMNLSKKYVNIKLKKICQCIKRTERIKL